MISSTPTSHLVYLHMSSWFNDDDVPKNLKVHSKRLYEYFEPKRAFVQHVKCLYNFGPLRGGYRGCSVQLKPTYVLSEADRIWIHEDLFKSTTVALCNVRSDTMDAKLDAVRARVWATDDLRGDNDFGVYVERRARDYSSTLEHVYYAILTQTPELDDVPLEGTLEQWIAQIRAAYTKVNAREDAMAHITSIFPKATCVDHKTTNMFMRDNSTWRFVNSVWNVRPSETDIFVRTHPSVGYSRFTLEETSRSKMIPIDMGYTEDVVSMETMDAARAQHIRDTHRWDSDQSVHARAQMESRAWRRDAPLRDMGIYDPTPLHTLALKLGVMTEPMTLDLGMRLTSGPIHYIFDTIAERLTPDALGMFRPELVHGNHFTLSRNQCAAFSIADHERAGP